MKLIKLSNERILYVSLFALYMACFLISTYFNYAIFDIEYVALAAIFFVGIITISRGSKGRVRSTMKYSAQMLNTVKMSLLLLGISLFFQVMQLNITPITLKHTIYIMFPSITVFFLCNTRKSYIEDYFNVALFFTIIYFLIRYSAFLNIDNIIQLDFLTSYSPFEFSSESVSDIFFFCVVFFGYKKKYIRMVVAALFGILSFKRFVLVCIVVSVTIFVVRSIKEKMVKTEKRQKYVPRSLCAALVIAVCMVPYLMEFIISDSATAAISTFLGMSADDFFKGRFELLRFLIREKPTNYGLGTVVEFMANTYWNVANGAMNLHNDIYRLYYETTIFGLFAFVHCMVKNTGRERKAFLLTAVFLANLVISNTLVNFMPVFMFNLLLCEFLYGNVSTDTASRNHQ